MQELQPISETNAVRAYHLNRNARPMQSTPNTTVARLLKPLIKPQETPEQVLTRVFKTGNYQNLVDYENLTKHLVAHQKNGDHRRWDEYAEKIPMEIRNQWRVILVECARNGFIAPHVSEKKISWMRVMTHGPMTDDLCTLCRRECTKREDIDTGEGRRRKQENKKYEEPKKCWEAAQ